MTKRRHTFIFSLALCAAVAVAAVGVFGRPTASPEQGSEAAMVANDVGDDPITISLGSYPGPWQPEALAQYADVIALGTVKEVLPARWNTADGKRHPSLGTSDVPPGMSHIYSPVILEVERYLKNPQAERTVTLYMLGGNVGQDRMVSDDAAQFQVGERVFVFLGRAVQRNDGVTARAINEKYGIAANGQSGSTNNPTISMSLDELVARTLAAPTKAPTK